MVLGMMYFLGQSANCGKNANQPRCRKRLLQSAPCNCYNAASQSLRFCLPRFGANHVKRFLSALATLTILVSLVGCPPAPPANQTSDQDNSEAADGEPAPMIPADDEAAAGSPPDQSFWLLFASVPTDAPLT